MLPINFDPNKDEFAVFKNLETNPYQEPKIKFLKNVRISNNSVVFKYFRIFIESCIGQANYEQYQKGYKFFLKFIFPKINFSKKRFLLITDEWTSNYYHWHLFALQRLCVLKEQGLIENSLVFLPKRYQHYKFALAALEKFGVKKKQVVFLRRKSNIKVSEVALVELALVHSDASRRATKILLENTKKIDFNFGDKIYLSREGQVLRYVENEAEVVSCLEKYGFKKIIAEKFSYDEQINIFRNCKYLVSPHGAGLTNLMFMKEGSYAFELASAHDTHNPNIDYFKLCNLFNINHLFQKCEARGKIRDFHQGSLLVDLVEFEKNLKLTLEYTQPTL